MKKPNSYWKKKLTPKQYHILRERGTEQAFSGKHNKTSSQGEYYCTACNSPLFSSKDKFDSGTGWPSFSRTLKNKVKIKLDFRTIIPQKELICVKCGSHLGHLFNDGPKPTGKRYCINSTALKFKKIKN